jgi:hypothetical protein
MRDLNEHCSEPSPPPCPSVSHALPTPPSPSHDCALKSPIRVFEFLSWRGESFNVKGEYFACAYSKVGLECSDLLSEGRHAVL